MHTCLRRLLLAATLLLPSLLLADDIAQARPTAAVIDLAKNPATALLEAELLQCEEATWVERTEIDRILKEQELQAAFGAAGVKERSSLGKLLKAEVLILVREVDSLDKKSKVIECIVCETKQGLRLKLAYLPIEKEPEKTAELLKQAAQAGITKSQEAISTIVAVPPLVSDDLGFQYNYLQSAYAKVIEQVLLAAPGVVVVEFGEAQAISRELLLAGENAVQRLQQPMLVLGRYRHSRNDANITVAVELRLVRGEQESEHKQAKSLSADAAGPWLHEQAGKLLKSVSDASVQSASMHDGAKELTRHAEEFTRVGNWQEALELLEASLLLNPQQERCHHDAVVAIGNLAREVKLDSRYKPHLEPDFESISELHRRGMQHLESFLASTGKLPRFWADPGPDFIFEFDGYFFSYGGSESFLPEANKHRKQFAQQRQQAFLKLARMRAKRGFVEENCFLRAVIQLPDSEKVKLAAAFVEELQDLPNLKQIALSCSPYGPRIFDIAPIRDYIKALKESKSEQVRAAGDELQRLMALGPKVDAVPKDLRKPPPPASETNLRPLDLVFDKPPVVGPALVNGFLATNPGIDVAWTYQTLFRMTEPGKLNEWWVAPLGRITDAVWDGRYLWAALADENMFSLAIGEPESGKVLSFGEKEGLPQEGRRIDRGVPQLRLASLGPGRIFIVGGNARVWLATLTMSDKGKPKLDVFHEAREPPSVDNVAQALSPKAAFPIAYVKTFSGIDKPTGLVEQRVLIGRGSSHRQVQLHPLVVDPDRKLVETASFTLDVRFPGEISGRGEELYFLEKDPPANPCLTRIVFPGIKQRLVKNAGQGLLWCGKDGVHMVGNRWDVFPVFNREVSTESNDEATPKNLAPMVPWRFMEASYKPYFGPSYVDSIRPPMYGLLDIGFSHHYGHIALSDNGPHPFTGKVFKLEVAVQK